MVHHVHVFSPRVFSIRCDEATVRPALARRKSRKIGPESGPQDASEKKRPLPYKKQLICASANLLITVGTRESYLH